MSEKRRCAYDGCRCWARRDGEWCAAHPEGKPRNPNPQGTGGAPLGNQNARTHGAYAGYVPVVALKDALRLPPGDLRLEIAAARAVISELLEAGLEPAALVSGLDRATAALARMLRVNKELADGSGGELETALEQVLSEMGLGGM